MLVFIKRKISTSLQQVKGRLQIYPKADIILYITMLLLFLFYFALETFLK